jgi:hypothetical protein
MKYEVTITLKVDAGYFYAEPDKDLRQFTITEEVYNALYDSDFLEIVSVNTEEV